MPEVKSIMGKVSKPRPVKITKSGIGVNGRLVKKTSNFLTRPELHQPSINVNTSARQLSEAGPAIVVEEPLLDFPTSSESRPTPRTHAINQQRTTEAWKKFSENALPFVVSGKAYADQATCDICCYPYEEERKPARCIDCLHFNHCSVCSAQMHKFTPFHNPEVWTEEGRYEKLNYNWSLVNNTREACMKAGQPIQEKLLFVTESGQLISSCFEYRHCDCHPLPLQLTEVGFWPSTPNQPTTAYSFRFLRLVQYMMLEGHMSLQCICQAFMWTHFWLPTECRKVYRQLSSECFEEFRHFLFELENDTTSAGECPACLKNGSVFYSLDGNFGLVRKTNSGVSYQAPKHKERYFLDDEEVDRFVTRNNIESDAHSEECSTFQAGDILRSKNRAQGLDQTGVFGSICRHGIPKLFLSMKYGERYAYPIYLLMKLLERTELGSAKPTIIYDIACRLHKHIERSDDINICSLLDGLDFAVPCWHAYGHGKECQRKYSTQFKEGCCLTDGEEMERLWSYLRGFSHITKEMTPSHRVDLLSDGLLHYAKRKKIDMPLHLVQQATKAKQIKEDAKKQLDALIQSTNKEGFDVAYIHNLDQAPTQPHQGNKQDLTNLTWQESYVANINKLNSLAVEMEVSTSTERVIIFNKQIESMEMKLKKTEKKEKIHIRWKSSSDEFKTSLKSMEDKKKKALIIRMKIVSDELDFHRNQKSKYSSGQKQAIKMAKQLKRSCANLRKLVKAYNSAKFVTDGTFPTTTTYEDVNSSKSTLFNSLETDGRQYLVPTSVADNAITLLNKVNRATEEEEQIVAEMDAYIKHFHSLVQKTQTQVDNLESSSQYSKGLKVVLQERIHDNQIDIMVGNSMFEKYIMNGEVPEDEPLYHSESEADISDSE